MQRWSPRPQCSCTPLGSVTLRNRVLLVRRGWRPPCGLGEAQISTSAQLHSACVQEAAGLQLCASHPLTQALFLKLELHSPLSTEQSSLLTYHLPLAQSGGQQRVLSLSSCSATGPAARWPMQTAAADSTDRLPCLLGQAHCPSQMPIARRSHA